MGTLFYAPITNLNNITSIRTTKWHTLPRGVPRSAESARVSKTGEIRWYRSYESLYTLMVFRSRTTIQKTHEGTIT